jgi:pyruvate/2-oxoglutarate dehydrogenase complex dihydrolipoamide acyltransferase (E2) component
MMEEVILPKLGSMMVGTVVEWLKKEGDDIKEGDEVVVIETEKVTHTVTADSSGKLLKILHANGSEVDVGTVIGYVGNEDEKVPE